MDTDITAIPIDNEEFWGRIAKVVVKKIHDKFKRHGALTDGTSEEDIFQSVMVEFFNPGNPLNWDPRKIRKGLSLEQGLANFLIGVAEYKMRDLNRSLGRRKLAPGDIDNLHNDFPAPEENLVETHDLLTKLLDPSERKIVALSQMGFNQSEVAGKLNLSNATVSRRKKDIRRKIGPPISRSFVAQLSQQESIIDGLPIPKNGNRPEGYHTRRPER